MGCTPADQKLPLLTCTVASARTSKRTDLSRVAWHCVSHSLNLRSWCRSPAEASWSWAGLLGEHLLGILQMHGAGRSCGRL